MRQNSGAKRKYAYLLTDPRIKVWYTNVSNKSELTADTYLRRLGWLLTEHGIDPRTLPDKKVEEVESILIGMMILEAESVLGSW